MKTNREVTPEIAEQRRWRARALLVASLTPEEFAAAVDGLNPPTLPTLFALARKRAAEHSRICPKCGAKLLLGGQPFTP